MQRIIKNNEVIDETWHLLPKDATLDGISNCDDLIVPLALWREHAHALKARDGGLGVWLDADEEAEEIGDDVEQFQVIALNFPAFTDGRNYSNARLLRDRYGYKGELRAIGDVLRDQLFYLHRCGFDAYAPVSYTHLTLPTKAWNTCCTACCARNCRIACWSAWAIAARWTRSIRTGWRWMARADGRWGRWTL